MELEHASLAPRPASFIDLNKNKESPVSDHTIASDEPFLIAVSPDELINTIFVKLSTWLLFSWLLQVFEVAEDLPVGVVRCGVRGHCLPFL
jgi:hypothetical protein